MCYLLVGAITWDHQDRGQAPARLGSQSFGSPVAKSNSREVVEEEKGVFTYQGQGLSSLDKDSNSP